jgi:hypothetical protein
MPEIDHLIESALSRLRKGNATAKLYLVDGEQRTELTSIRINADLDQDDEQILVKAYLLIADRLHLTVEFD